MEERSMTHDDLLYPTVRAADLRVGTQLAEEDGYLWDVSEIVRETASTITVRLNSDFSSYRSHWHGEPGHVKTFRKAWLLYGRQPNPREESS